MLDRKLSEIKGIGPRRAALLGAQGLFSLRDILYFFPKSYKDFSVLKFADELINGEEAVVRVRAVSSSKVHYIRRNMNMVSVKTEDARGNKLDIVWFNQTYRASQVPQGGYFFACGRVDGKKGTKMINPALCDSLPGIVPGSVKGITNKLITDLVKDALAAVTLQDEVLPEKMLKKYALMSKNEAVRIMHMPQSVQEIKAARRTLAFEDMLLFRIMMFLSQGVKRAEREYAFCVDGLYERFKAKLPFELTGAQARAIAQINSDISRKTAMNRLIQGDVGSGKTAVAFYAMYAAVENDTQAALMAPTEILAQQHFERIKTIFSEEEAVLLTGSMKKSERDRAFERIRNGQAKVIVGTHALLFSKAEFNNLGMVIVDEQHRFGVRQRALLQNKESVPHMLVMSATPIPRTLALIIYGDLDISVIDELPKGRKKVITRIVPEFKRDDMYEFVEKNAKAGHQTFIVCPLIESSEALENVESATELYKELKSTLKAKTALLTGQTDAAQKQLITEAFSKGDIDVLISTTVIEVGVDVPNASVMIIESADRFGLAQLHQLRGRVGRGDVQSYCFLLSSSHSESAKERLNILASTNDGFKIAEYDLECRGPGEFLGARQHGLDEFSAASLAMDVGVLNDAVSAAKEVVENSTKTEYKKLFALAYEKLKNKSDIAMN